MEIFHSSFIYILDRFMVLIMLKIETRLLAEVSFWPLLKVIQIDVSFHDLIQNVVIEHVFLLLIIFMHHFYIFLYLFKLVYFL